MNSSMRKIVYYEFMLEFKESTQSELSLMEVNNWQLCRTCLNETKDSDVEVSKMCIMDSDRRCLLPANEMLEKITSIKIVECDELPSKMCKQCLENMTNLYYFSVQIEKAQCVLRKLLEKLNGAKENIERSKERVTDEHDNEACSSTTIQQDDIHVITITNEEKVLETKNQVKDAVMEVDEKDNFIDTQSDDTVDIESESTVRDEYTDNDGFIDTQLSHSVDYESNGSIREENNESQAYNDSKQNEWTEKRKDEHIENITDQIESPCDTDNYITEDDVEDMLQDIYVIEEDNDEMGSITETKLVKQQFKGKIAKPKNERKQLFKHKQPRIKKPLLESTECGICKRKFQRQCDLVAHVKEEHPNSKAYQCRECLAFFSHTQSLSRHMNSHKPVVEKNCCDYCSKTFLRPDDLKRHIRTHTGERPYACSLCDKSFKQNSELNQHLLTHSGQKSYQCDQCDRSYASRNSLYLHKKIHKSSN
ncbi:uncharacterized protein [Musca autumnalis]|uniref:uncharacterized protein n=1 Tax=Musca autumnalis TaxID=221902 RepID=UPI003CEF73F9